MSSSPLHPHLTETVSGMSRRMSRYRVRAARPGSYDETTPYSRRADALARGEAIMATWDGVETVQVYDTVAHEMILEWNRPAPDQIEVAEIEDHTQIACAYVGGRCVAVAQRAPAYSTGPAWTIRDIATGEDSPCGTRYVALRLRRIALRHVAVIRASVPAQAPAVEVAADVPAQAPAAVEAQGPALEAQAPAVEAQAPAPAPAAVEAQGPAFQAIQCTAVTGERGTYLYRGDSPATGALVSPVFADTLDLWRWTDANGWTRLPYDPAYPCGAYAKSAAVEAQGPAPAPADEERPLESLAAVVARLQLTVSAEFVPFSRSRHAKPKPRLRDRSLNWVVRLQLRGREILATDYTAGIGHCPSYKAGARETLDYAECIARETETGRRWGVYGFQGRSIVPNPLDVIHSLAIEAGALDHAGFDDWAADYGYDSDSRDAERIYRECLSRALVLRNALGERDLAALREAAAAY